MTPRRRRAARPAGGTCVTFSCEFLTGSTPVHSTHCVACQFLFVPAGAVLGEASTPASAFGFFLYYTLDKVVCQCLANHFGMRIFHATTEAEVKALLNAAVDV